MIPPRSPFSLIQEDLWPDRWRILVVSVMLNRTSRKQVEKILPTFFLKWPTPEALFRADSRDVRACIASLGFKNRRTEHLQKLSDAYLNLDWKDPRDLPGVGEYGAACYDIFCKNLVPVDPPRDHALRQYVIWWNKRFRSV